MTPLYLPATDVRAGDAVIRPAPHDCAQVVQEVVCLGDGSVLLWLGRGLALRYEPGDDVPVSAPVAAAEPADTREPWGSLAAAFVALLGISAAFVRVCGQMGGWW